MGKLIYFVYETIDAFEVKYVNQFSNMDDAKRYAKKRSKITGKTYLIMRLFGSVRNGKYRVE